MRVWAIAALLVTCARAEPQSRPAASTWVDLFPASALAWLNAWTRGERLPPGARVDPANDAPEHRAFLVDGGTLFQWDDGISVRANGCVVTLVDEQLDGNVESVESMCSGERWNKDSRELVHEVTKGDVIEVTTWSLGARGELGPAVVSRQPRIVP